MEEKMEFALNHRFDFLIVDEQLVFVTEKIGEENVVDEVYSVGELLDFLEGKPDARPGSVLLAMGRGLLLKALKYGGIL